MAPSPVVSCPDRTPITVLAARCVLVGLLALLIALPPNRRRCPGRGWSSRCWSPVWGRCGDLPQPDPEPERTLPPRMGGVCGWGSTADRSADRQRVGRCRPRPPFGCARLPGSRPVPRCRSPSAAPWILTLALAVAIWDQHHGNRSSTRTATLNSGRVTRIALLSSPPTPDLLSARTSGADYSANPSKAGHTEMAVALEAVTLSWSAARFAQGLCSGFARSGPPESRGWWWIGEQVARCRPDGAVHGAHRRRRRGARLSGAGRPCQPRPAARLPLRHRPAHRIGFEPPPRQPTWGTVERSRRGLPATSSGSPVEGPRGARWRSAPYPSTSQGTELDGPRWASSSTGRSTPPATPRTSKPSPTRSTRRWASGCPFRRLAARRPRRPAAELGTLDALITTVLGGRGTGPRRRRPRRGRGLGRSGAAALDIPILQGLCLTARAPGGPIGRGHEPARRAPLGRVPSFDGRLITVPFSFK